MRLPAHTYNLLDRKIKIDCSALRDISYELRQLLNLNSANSTIVDAYAAMLWLTKTCESS
ncbi:hypothetical protein D3C78_1932450 [compost metagenome]